MTEAPTLDSRKEIRVQEWLGESEALGVEYSDGSRIDGAAAGATTTEAEYLGRYATVMDAEMLGIALSLEAHNFTVALDSQGAMTGVVQLYTESARSWIELSVQKAMSLSPACLMW